MSIFARIINKVLRYFSHRPVLKNAKKNTESLIAAKIPKNLLILCYGNIYRSPFVANYLEKKLVNSGINICSAGTYPKTGRRSPEKHIQMSKNFGVDLADHCSTVVDKKLLDWADWIVIMDRRNWDELEVYGESVRNKLIWLGALDAKDGVEIHDPYGKSEAETESILKQLQLCSDELAKFI